MNLPSHIGRNAFAGMDVYFVPSQTASETLRNSFRKVFLNCQDKILQAAEKNDANSGQGRRPVRAARVRWIAKEDLVRIVALHRDALFVCEEFQGKAFDYLREKFCWICGPEALEKRPSEIISLASRFPCFDELMSGMVVSFSGVPKIDMGRMRERLMVMGGTESVDLRASTTHLVAARVGSAKYFAASTRNTAIMKPTWIDELWKQTKLGPYNGRGQMVDIINTESEVLPYLYGLVIYIGSDFGEASANMYKNMISRAGGLHTDDVKHPTLRIILCREKLKEQENLPRRVRCVKLEWLLDSVKQKRCLRWTRYLLEECVSMQSMGTPSTVRRNRSDRSRVLSSLQKSVTKTPLKRSISECSTATSTPKRPSRSAVFDLSPIRDEIAPKVIQHHSGGFVPCIQSPIRILTGPSFDVDPFAGIPSSQEAFPASSYTPFRVLSQEPSHSGPNEPCSHTPPCLPSRKSISESFAKPASPLLPAIPNLARRILDLTAGRSHESASSNTPNGSLSREELMRPHRHTMPNLKGVLKPGERNVAPLVIWDASKQSSLNRRHSAANLGGQNNLLWSPSRRGDQGEDANATLSPSKIVPEFEEKNAMYKLVHLGVEKICAEQIWVAHNRLLSNCLPTTVIARVAGMFCYPNIVGPDPKLPSLIQNAVTGLKGRYISSKNLDPECTHLIMARPSMTAKFFACIASGKWILHTQYIFDSEKEGRFLPEEDYEWGSRKAGKLMSGLEDCELKWALVAHWWRDTIHRTEKKPFEGWKVVLPKDLRRYDGYHQILMFGGASIYDESETVEKPTLALHDYVLKPEQLAAYKSRYGDAVQHVDYVDKYLENQVPSSKNFAHSARPKHRISLGNHPRSSNMVSSAQPTRRLPNIPSTQQGAKPPSSSNLNCSAQPTRPVLSIPSTQQGTKRPKLTLK